MNYKWEVNLKSRLCANFSPLVLDNKTFGELCAQILASDSD